MKPVGGALLVLPLQDGLEFDTVEIPHCGVSTCVFVADGQKVICGTTNGQLCLYEVRSKQKLVVRPHSDEVTTIVSLPQGNCIASTSLDGSIRILDSNTLRELASIVVDSPVTCLAVTPDGTRIVAGDRLGVVHFLEYRVPETSQREN
jgi:WD40 repeat protein